MAWTGTIALDPDKPDVGVATAVWDTGQADVFTYSRRAKMSVADKNAFVIEAHAALTAFQALTTAQVTFATSLTTALNS